MRKNYFYVLLVLLFIIALSLRLYQLDVESIWIDEGYTLYHDQQPSIFEVSKVSIKGIYLPFYHILLSKWILIFGISEYNARFLSVIFGFFSVIMIYLLGKLIFNRKVGVMAAIILALSSYHIYFSQEVRSYGLLFLLALISFYFFFRYLDSKGEINLVPYSIFTFLFLITHAFAPLAIIVQNIYLFIFNRKSLKKIKVWTTSQAVIFAAALPFYYFWLIEALGYSRTAWIPRPDTIDLIKTIYSFIAGETNTTTSLILGGLLVVVFGFLIIYLLFSYLKADIRQKIKADIGPLLLLIIWFIFPIAALFVMSFATQPVYVTRYIIYSSAPLYLLIAYSVSKFGKLKQILFVSLIILISLGILYMDFTTQNKEDWEGVSEYLRENIKMNDAVLVNTPTSIYSLSYYYDQNCFTSSDIKDCLNSKNIFGVRNSNEIPFDIIGEKNIYLILFNSNYVDTEGTILSYFNDNYLFKYKKDFNQIEINYFSSIS